MKKILFAMAAALLICSTASAQRRQMTQEERDKMRAEMVQRQTESMVKELKLEGEAKTAFAETYTQYMNELNEAMGMGNENQRQSRNDETKPEKMTDEECYGKIKENLDQQQKQIEQSTKRLEITKKYMALLLPTLTAQQLYKVFGQRQRGWGGQMPNGGFGGGRGQGGFGGGRGGFGGGQGGFGGGGF
ncbi:MAG: hypothetical protein KBT39_05290 [Bacteroidales bacterium]|nr:hypothetical protein [Bacteroidales bacterium]